MTPEFEDSGSEHSDLNPDSRRLSATVSAVPEELQFLKIRDTLNHFVQQLHKQASQRVRFEEETRPKFTVHKSIRVHDQNSLRRKYSFITDTVQHNEVARAFQCVISGHSGELFDLLLEFPGLLKAHDPSGANLLHCAVEKGRLEVVNLLLSRGADVNALDAMRNTPIHLAIRARRMDILELLISNGAQLTWSNKDGLQPVHLAAELAFVDCLKRLLLYRDVDVDALDERGSTPLYHCCSMDSDECMRILLKNGANMYHKNAFGSSVVHEAILQLAVKCVHLLFDHETITVLQEAGRRPQKLSAVQLEIEVPTSRRPTHLFGKLTDWIRINPGGPIQASPSSGSLSTISDPLSTSRLINLVDDEGFSAIHIAVNTSNMELIKVCLDRGANILAPDMSGQTPLHYACIRGDLDCAKALLEHHPKYTARMISAVNHDGRTPIHLAAMYNHPTLIDYLLSQGAELNVRDKKSLTPLLLACWKGAIKSVVHLMRIGADLLCCDENGRNMVCLLLLSGVGESREVVPDLIQTGKASILFNQPDRWGCTFMHLAARLGLRVAVKVGASLGGHVLTKDVERSTPLHSAARFGRYQICSYMLELDEGKRALFLADHKGRLPLHVAAQYGNNRVVELLLANGCLYRRCHEGNTPLHYAAIEGNADTCALLLTMNPSILNEVNYQGSTALHFAAMHANEAVVSYLLTAGADIIPDHNGLYFTSLAFQPESYLASKAIALHKRFPEIVAKLWNTDQCPIEKMIHCTPSIFLLVLDVHVTECGKRNTPEHGTKYDFALLQAPPKATDKKPVAPMKLMKLMVKLKREELLTHPLCRAYLEMKWTIYGRWIQLLVTLYHFCISLSITWLALRQMPLSVNYDNPWTAQCVDLLYGHQQNYAVNRILPVVILVSNGMHMLIKSIEFMSQRWEYFKEWNNCLLTIFQILATASAILNLLDHRTAHCAALTLIVMFIAWFNVLLQLLRFQSIGIFVIMFLQVATTIMKSALVLSLLFIAFAITFHKLLTLPEEQEFQEAPRFLKNRLAYCFLGFEHLNRSQDLESQPSMELPMKAYSNMGLALFQTLMMMVGEYEHMEVIIKPYLDGYSATIYIPELTFPFFALFVFLMPISVMNLMIGLAVGDIDKVRRSATQQLIAQQVYWLENLETRCPMWLYRQIYVPFWIKRPAVPITKRDPHKHEVQQDLSKLKKTTHELSEAIQRSTNMLDQIVQQIGISKYETETDQGNYDEVNFMFGQAQTTKLKKRQSVIDLSD